MFRDTPQTAALTDATGRIRQNLAGDGGYGAWCPDLPGCVALAGTQGGVLAELQPAIEMHIAGLREDGQPVPRPSTVAATVITLDAA